MTAHFPVILAHAGIHLRFPVILANAGIHLRIPIVRQYSRSKNLPMLKQPAVYILASQPRGTLYIGVSSNLIQRI